MRSAFNLRNFLFAAILLLSAILNFYQFDKNPPGLYIDEVSIGVNAYSILRRGTDEYGEPFPIYFKAYGEYKLPVYIYLTAASMRLFGKNEFAVRFPSAFLGTLSLIFLYLLAHELAVKRKFALLFVFLLSVSPWFLHFVGPAFEAIAAFFFFILACYLLLVSQRKKSTFIYCLSLLFFVITVYTYHSYKVLIPIIFLFIMTKSIRGEKRQRANFARLFLTLIFLLPILYSFLFRQASARYLQTTAFASVSANNVILFLQNYISYFSTDFLFSFGDGINRHQFLNFGVLARWSLPFMLIGFFAFLKQKRSYLKYAALGLLAIAPIPASLTLPSPHSLRSLTMVAPYMLIVSCGIIYAVDKFKRFTRFLVLTLVLIFAYEFSVYLHFGFFHYPKIALIDWGGSYKEVVQKAAQLTNKYPYIVVDESLAFAPEYFRFYDESLKPTLIKPGWQKENVYGNKPVLLITSDTSGGSRPSNKLLDVVYLPNINRNIFAQFWEL